MDPLVIISKACAFAPYTFHVATYIRRRVRSCRNSAFILYRGIEVNLHSLPTKKGGFNMSLLFNDDIQKAINKVVSLGLDNFMFQEPSSTKKHSDDNCRTSCHERRTSSHRRSCCTKQRTCNKKRTCCKKHHTCDKRRTCCTKQRTCNKKRTCHKRCSCHKKKSHQSPCFGPQLPSQKRRDCCEKKQTCHKRRPCCGGY